MSFLEDCAAIGGADDVEQALNGREEFLVAQRERSQLLSLGYRLLRSATDDNLAQQGAVELASDIRYLLAQVLIESKTEVPTLLPAVRCRAVERALEVIHARNGQITILALCRRSAASARKLSRGFRERFGISAKRGVTPGFAHVVQWVLVRTRSRGLKSLYRRIAHLPE